VVVAALAAGFGAVISEVGAVTIVGGDIRHATRVLTTAVVLETRKGALAEAAVLGLVLLGVTLVVSGLLVVFGEREAA
jgi:tungstate transport system permease protein